MAKRKYKKDYFEEYPLREKIGVANFTIKLKSGDRDLRFSPEQFGRGLTKDMREAIGDVEWSIIRTLRMKELTELSQEDRGTHFDWMLDEIMTNIKGRRTELIDKDIDY